MSKPNLLAFSSSVGIYRNKRMRDLRQLLLKSVPAKIDFAEQAPMLFQVVMAYAAENQIDGKFEDYNTTDWVEIFATNHVHVTAKQADSIIQAFERVGLFDHSKIRSWAKYNRHLADYEGFVKAKRLAGKLSAKKRQLEARAALKNGKISESETDSEPQKSEEKSPSPSKQLWLLERAMQRAEQQKDKKALKALRAQRDELLAESTGVEIEAPAPSPALPASKPHKADPGEFQRTALKNARVLIEQGNADLLTEAMVKALHAAGDELPAEARRKFPKLVAELGSEPRNPVPG